MVDCRCNICREPLCDVEITSWALIALLMVTIIEWLIADVTSVGSPARAKCDILEIILDLFGQFRPLLWSGDHSVILMKTEGLFTNVICICRVPYQSLTWYFGLILDIFWPIQANFCGRGATLQCSNPLLSSNNFLGSFNEYRVICQHYVSCRTPWQSGTCYFGDVFSWAFFGQFRPILSSGSQFVM